MITEKLLKLYPVPIFSSSPSKMYHVLSSLEYIINNNIDGDIVELGVETGQTSIYIQRMLNEYKQNRKFHVYDSWEGVPEPNDFDLTNIKNPFNKGDCKSSKDIFINRFKQENIELPIIHSGWFNKIQDNEYPSKIAFAFFDGDLYSSIMDSFNKVYHKLVPNARVIIDDYKWERTPGVEKACKDFLKDKPEKEIFLPNYRANNEGGGALLIKQYTNKKILLLYTSHRQLYEVYLQGLLYQRFPENYKNISNVDILFYCNSSEIPEQKLIKYLNLWPQKNKTLIHTDKNIGYKWGGHEAVSETYDIWKDYDTCIHIHPDVFILQDNIIWNIINNTNTDFITSYNLDPNKTKHFAFDFFIFNPKQIFNKHDKIFNFFDLYLDENQRNNTDMPEQLLLQLINKYNLTSGIVQRYHNHHWEPRRPDMIGLYHEHDLNKIINITNYNIVPVFINIERFKERKENCINIFKNLFPNRFYQFSGVDGKYINIHPTSLKNISLVQFNNELYIHNSNYRSKKMSYGEFGCILSHLKLLEFIIQNNINSMLICEDDILPLKEYKEIEIYLKNLPHFELFDICLLHHNSEKYKNNYTKLNDYFCKITGNKPQFTLALSYIITFNGANKILSQIKSNLNIPYDDQLSEIKDLNIIYSKEQLFNQNVDILKSSIWNIYKNEEHYDHVKWDKEINTIQQNNELIEINLR